MTDVLANILGPLTSSELPIVAGTSGLVALIIMAVIRVLTHDRDEGAIIRAWKQRAEAEAKRADRFDEENRRLRGEVRRLSNVLIREGLSEHITPPVKPPDF